MAAGKVSSPPPASRPARALARARRPQRILMARVGRGAAVRARALARRAIDLGFGVSFDPQNLLSARPHLGSGAHPRAAPPHPAHFRGYFIFSEISYLV